MTPRLGYSWYNEATYARLLEVVRDRLGFADNYQSWCRVAQRQVETLEKRGVQVIKIDVDPDEMLRWCLQRGLYVDARGRSAFSGHKLSEIIATKQQTRSRP